MRKPDKKKNTEKSGNSDFSRSLRNSSIFIDSLFDAVLVGICVTDEDARFVEVNEEYCRIYGYSKEELIGERITMVVDPEFADAVLKIHSGYVAGKNIGEKGEFEVRRKGGEKLFIKASQRNLISPEGKRYVVTSIQDITQGKVLKQREIRGKALLERSEHLSETGSWVLNPNSGKAFISRKLRDILGIDPEIDVVENGIDFILDRTFEKDIERAKKHYQRAIETEEGFEFEQSVVRTDGTLRQVRVSGKSERDEIGSRRLYVIFRDITEQKRVVGQLGAVTDNLDVAVFRYERTKTGVDRIKHLNKGAEKLWGVDAETAMADADSIWKLTHPDDYEKLDKSVRESAEKLEKWECEWRSILPDGAVKWQRGMGTPDRNPDGSTVWDSIVIDITPEKEAEKQLRKVLADLKERVKEQTCLYEISNLPEQELSREELTDHTMASIRKAMQYPEDTEVRIEFNRFKNSTPGFGKVLEELKLKANCNRVKNRTLSITVGYTAKHSKNKINEFLSEERKMLDSAARLLCMKLEQKEAVAVLNQTVTVLKQTKDEFMQLVNTIDGIVWEADPETFEFRYLSDQVKNILGYTPEEWLSEKHFWESHIHPDDREKAVNHCKVNSAAGRDHNFEYRMKTASGDYKWLYDKVAVIKEEGKPALLRGVLVDITDKKEREAELLLLESVITNTKDSVLITEADLLSEPGPRIIYANGSFCKMSGYESHEILGRSPRMFQGPKTDQGDLRKIRKALTERENIEIDLVNYRKDGVPYWVNMSITPVFDNAGKCTHFIAVERDVTEQKNEYLQKELIADIGRIFNSKSSLYPILDETLTRLANFDDYELLEVWLTDPYRDHIRLVSKYPGSGSTSIFHKESSEMTGFERGKGLPGSVWKSGEIRYWRNIDKQKAFLRREAASKAGLKSAYGIPLFHGDEVIGVLVLGLKENIDNPRHIGVFREGFGNYLGSELKRKQVEDEINRIFNTASDIICVIGFDGKFKKINPAASKLLGYDESEILSHSYTDFIHPEDDSSTREELKTFADNTLIEYYENRYITRDAKVVWLAWTATLDEDTESIYAIAKDITERKKLEKLLDKAVTLSRVGAWEADLTTGKVNWSQMAREINEADDTFEPEVNSGSEVIKHDADKARVQKLVEESIMTGQPWDAEFEIITYKGNTKWVRSMGEPEYHNGQCIRLVGNVQDIDARKRGEVELKIKTRYLEAISQVNNTLINYRDWHDALYDCFEIMGKHVNADRVYFFEFSGEELINYEVEWCAEGIESFIDKDDLKDVPAKDIPEFIDPLKKGKPFKTVVKDLPKSFTKEALEMQGIKSLLVIPVMIRGKLEGMLGIDNCSDEQLWSESEEQFLQTISDAVSSAYEARESRKELETAFREKETILESISDAFYAVDDNWRFTYFNKEAERLLNRKAKNIIGKKYLKAFPKTKGSLLISNFENVMSSGKPILFEYFYPGTKRWYEVNAYPGESGFSAYFKDVTEKREALRQIQESNERFERVSGATNDAIWDWDVKSSTLYKGEGFKKLFGYETGEVRCSLSSSSRNIHPDDAPRVDAEVERLISSKGETALNVEYRYKKADGDYAYVIDRGSVIRDEDGNAVRMVGAMQDITHRKKYEDSLKKLNEDLAQKAKELEISNRELEQFAYVASHDLQEPLRMITGFITQLDKKYGDVIDEKGKKYINFAVDGAKRMRHIILDLLEFSRVGRSDERAADVDLNDVVDEIEILYRKRIKETGAEIIRRKLPVIKAEVTPVRQIFQNLVSNAIKYSKQDVKPRVEIEFEDRKDEYKFSVADNGIGIEPEYFEKVFIIFQRLHPSERYSGTGVGLALTKKIIENWGGEIWLESEPEEGSTFHFTLPKKRP